MIWTQSLYCAVYGAICRGLWNIFNDAYQIWLEDCPPQSWAADAQDVWSAAAQDGDLEDASE